jgi:DNA-directed RNA polymerase subunit RPC12/RpoP
MCVFAWYRYTCKDCGKTWTGAHGDVITDPKDLFPVCSRCGSKHVEQKVSDGPLLDPLERIVKRVLGRK